MHLIKIEKSDATRAWENPIREKLKEENLPAYARHCVIAEAFRREGFDVSVQREFAALVVVGKSKLGKPIKFRVPDSSPLAQLQRAFDLGQIHTVMKLLPMRIQIESGG